MVTGPGDGSRGRGHGPLSDELRQLFDLLAERSEPVLRRLAGDGLPDPEHPPTTCDWCPLCATLALLRGERSELAVNSAELTARLVAALRVLLGGVDDAPDGRADRAERADRADRKAGAHRAAEPRDGVDDGLGKRGGAHRATADTGSRVQRIDLRPAGQPIAQPTPTSQPTEPIPPVEQRQLHAVPSSQQPPSSQPGQSSEPAASSARVQRISLRRKD